MLCGICKVKAVKYTCPNCSVHYCSLNCYRSTTHRRCSEAFYRNEVLSEIQTENVENGEESAFTQIVSVLKEALLESDKPGDARKPESTTAETSKPEDAESSEDADEEADDKVRQKKEVKVKDLETRLEGLDLDLDSAEIWTRLTERERADFLSQCADGSLERLLTTNSAIWWEQLDAAEWPTSVREASVQSKLDSAAVRNGDKSQLALTLLRTLLSYALAVRLCAFHFDAASDDELCVTVDCFLRLSELANVALRHQDLRTTVAECSLKVTELLPTRSSQPSDEAIRTSRGSKLKVQLLQPLEPQTRRFEPTTSFERVAVALNDVVTLRRRNLIGTALAHAAALLHDAIRAEEEHFERDFQCGRQTTQSQGLSHKKRLFLAQKKLQYLHTWQSLGLLDDDATFAAEIDSVRTHYESECAGFSCLQAQVEATHVRDTVRNMNEPRTLITELN